MKKIGLILSLLLLTFTFSACSIKPVNTSSNNTGAPKRLKVASTIFPLHDIVRRVGADKIDAILILPPGSSPHTFEASPSQAKEIQNVDVMFKIGGEVDSWVTNLVSAGNKDLKVIDLSQTIVLKPFEAQVNSDNNNLDPHYWLDPTNALIMVDEIVQELSLQDNTNAAYYQEQGNNYKEEIKARDIIWQEKLASLNNKELVVFHDAWGYFASHFGLKIAATFEPFPGKSPSPQYLKDLQDVVKEHKIKAVFVEPQLAGSTVSALAQDLNLKVYSLDPIGGMKDKASYIGTMDFNINSIYEALK